MYYFALYRSFINVDQPCIHCPTNINGTLLLPSYSEMAARRNLWNKDCKNYICARQALDVAGEALESFTVNGLHAVHQHITQNLGNVPMCTRQCSSVLRDFNRYI